MSEKIGILGLGYVGLPVALAFARHYPAVGFDINRIKVEELKRGIDRTGETEESELKESTLQFSSDENDLRDCTFFVIAVPTPIDLDKRPDLTPVVKASETVARVIQPGAVVVYESTVYPGVTEEIAGPVIERLSGLKQGADFKLGYSPERINPGDKEHTLAKIVKVVSGEDEPTLRRVSGAYGKIIDAGLHEASSIKVAEAAKVIENTQRDLNIAFVNELAIIFDRMGISTKEVLDAAQTKWNFLRFRPGLVGGHCIGVDPYYLTMKAEQLGYRPEVILAGRRINDGMGAYVANKTIKLMIHQDIPVKGARVGILGATFKENVSDIRNSRVIDIVTELQSFGAQTLWHDPYADADEVLHEYDQRLCHWTELQDLDALIVAVSHQEYLAKGLDELIDGLHPEGVFVDVKSIFERGDLPDGMAYWSL